MKAKACTRCRQWKVGCDANISGSEGCTRCQEHGVPCVFDSTFRRTFKKRKLAEMQVELDELRALANVTAPQSAPAAPPKPVPASFTALPSPSAVAWPFTVAAQTALVTAERDVPGLCIADKYIDGIHLASSHVNELFRIYFRRYHPYLPFSMCRAIEAIHEKCPALFWVICAAASTERARSQFREPIRKLISDVLDPLKGNTVEMVQALLILCMWPFAFSNQRSDPSFVYSGIATQISLGLRLHRSAMDADYGKENGEHREDEQIRKTTWLACFIVAQIHASRRGVPAIIQADHSLLSFCDDPAVPKALSHLCYISHLTVDSTHALGVRGSNAAGLVEPSARISLINAFAKQFDDLRRQRFPKPSDIVEMFFLSSKLQLWSFALHNDVPMTANTVQIISQAREDAIRLVQVACEKNLSLVPFYTRRSVNYAALLLYRVKLGPYGWQDDMMIDHHVERAQQALGASEGLNFGHFLATVTSPDNRNAVTASGDKNSPYRSRMGACLVFDFHRAYTDLQQASITFPSDFADFDSFVWTEP